MTICVDGHLLIINLQRDHKIVRKPLSVNLIDAFLADYKKSKTSSPRKAFSLFAKHTLADDHVA